jgi:type I restriction enzyme M protein
MDRSLSAYERVTLYGEGLEKMNLNPNLFQFFRNVFKGAFLPFRDPEVLTLFLKQIDEFKYGHNGDLGDAFEYLLQVMGTQGDAGQFLTPRHIINFIVNVVEPDINDRILDPACGTGGFLISAYKFIEKHKISESGKTPGKLTIAERRKLTNNFVGYDITHDLVRLSLVNLYLHDFPDPKIHEYDTLTSLEKWDDDFECILTNPPFMTPKGGIRPHKRFCIQANRSEVLFVDYVMEHITPNGKAGIIVPEGIIFQSANAYKSLRKMMIEQNYLYAVVSLPAGVFQAYSGVKTSILFVDRVLAKKTDQILFAKVENDGFDLGAQGRPIEKNDLPRAERILGEWKQSIQTGKMIKLEGDTGLIHLVQKQRISTGDYNLSGDRYRTRIPMINAKWPIMKLGDASEIAGGVHITPPLTKIGVPMLDSTDIRDMFIDDSKPSKFISLETDKELSKRCKPQEGDILISSRGSIGKVAIVKRGQNFNIMGNQCCPNYLKV